MLAHAIVIYPQTRHTRPDSLVLSLVTQPLSRVNLPCLRDQLMLEYDDPELIPSHRLAYAVKAALNSQWDRLR